MRTDTRTDTRTDIYDVFDRLGLNDDTEHVTELNRAGIDDATPVDTFLNANGDYIYVTEISHVAV